MRYKKDKSLGRFYEAILRKAATIVISFLCLYSVAFVLIFSIKKQEFESKITIANSTSISLSAYEEIKRAMLDEKNISAVCTELSSKSVKINNKEITTKDIVSNLSFSNFDTNTLMYNFNIVFKSSDKSTTSIILDTYSFMLLNNLKSSFAGLTILGSASNAKETSDRKDALIVSSLIIFIPCFFTPIIYDFYCDTISNGKEVERMGASAFEMRVSTR